MKDGLEIGQVVRPLTYLALTFGAAVACWLLCMYVPVEVAVVLVQVCAGALVIVMERIWTFSHAWRNGSIRSDGLHAIVGLGITQAMLAGATSLAQFGVDLAWWPVQWPLFVQVVLFVLIQEFMGYWAHRWLHGGEGLWRVHAIHHGARRLYWLNGFRLHPLDVVWMVGLTLIWAPLSGVPLLVFGVSSCYVTTHLLLQHANVALYTGVFSPVLATSEFHRWHHQPTELDAACNYGHVLGVFDVLFGTYRPGITESTLEVGLDDWPAPQTYVEQLKAPRKP